MFVDIFGIFLFWSTDFHVNFQAFRGTWFYGGFLVWLGILSELQVFLIARLICVNINRLHHLITNIEAEKLPSITNSIISQRLFNMIQLISCAYVNQKLFFVLNIPTNTSSHDIIQFTFPTRWILKFLLLF